MQFYQTRDFRALSSQGYEKIGPMMRHRRSCGRRLHTQSYITLWPRLQPKRHKSEIQSQLVGTLAVFFLFNLFLFIDLW